MKNRIIALLILALGLSWAYFLKKDFNRIDVAQVPIFGNSNQNLNISLSDATERIENYGQWAAQVMHSREQAGAPKQDTLPVAWTISIDSLKKLELEEEITAIRLYILLKDEVIPRPTKDNFPTLQLATVGVLDHRDLVHGKMTNLIHPCPKVCDRSSPLWKAYVKGLKGEGPVDN